MYMLGESESNVQDTYHTPESEIVNPTGESTKLHCVGSRYCISKLRAIYQNLQRRAKITANYSRSSFLGRV
jgi:hypothetical protein